MIKVVKAIVLIPATNLLPHLEILKDTMSGKDGYGLVKGFSNTTNRHKIKRKLKNI